MHILISLWEQRTKNFFFIQYTGGHDIAASYLIDAGAEVWEKNNDNTTPLHFACAEGHYEVVQVKKTTQKNNDNTTHLHFAGAEGLCEVVQVKLKATQKKQ
jgi:ankyrin repeat protein